MTSNILQSSISQKKTELFAIFENLYRFENINGYFNIFSQDEIVVQVRLNSMKNVFKYDVHEQFIYHMNWQKFTIRIYPRSGNIILGIFQFENFSLEHFIQYYAVS